MIGLNRENEINKDGRKTKLSATRKSGFDCVSKKSWKHTEGKKDKSQQLEDLVFGCIASA